MNRLLLSTLAFLALANMALAMVCTENFCATVDCLTLSEETCDYTIVPNGGMCGCCDACINFLKEGEKCPTIHVRGGPPPTTKCGEGLVCNSETGRCEAA
ncbi:hypothetical protein BsWGS_25432 [Bradybaena similaris]